MSNFLGRGAIPLERLPQAGSNLMSGGRLSMLGRMCSRDLALARLSLQADARPIASEERVATQHDLA